jgi:hypothetical protein
MNARINVTCLAQDLAGQWIEPALEILRASGVRRISVAMELETWRIMTQILRFQIPRESGFRLRPFASVENLKEEVLFQATLLVRRKFAYRTDTAGWSERVRPWIRDHDSTYAERVLYFQAFRGSKSPRRTDSYAKVGVAAVGS